MFLHRTTIYYYEFVCPLINEDEICSFSLNYLFFYFELHYVFRVMMHIMLIGVGSDLIQANLYILRIHLFVLLGDCRL